MDENRIEGTARNLGGKAQEGFRPHMNTISIHRRYGDALPGRAARQLPINRQHDPSIEILIADINMPGLSGTELAQRARSFRDQLPVILLSGRESDSHGYPLIRKPILRSDLQRVVAEKAGPAKGR
jgi:CheY-like chemotaxis protein